MTSERDQASVRPPRLPPQEFDSILEAARAGADWAWRRIVESYSPSLLGYVRFRGAQDPEDTLSEMWMTAATGLRRFTGDEPAFRSWLFVIAHRRVIDSARKRSRRLPPADPYEVESRPMESVQSAEASALELVSTETVAALLSHLTDQQRAVIELRVVADLSLRETARILGKRIGSVKALQKRGLEALRRQIQDPEVSKAQRTAITRVT